MIQAKHTSKIQTLANFQYTNPSKLPKYKTNCQKIQAYAKFQYILPRYKPKQTSKIQA